MSEKKRRIVKVERQFVDIKKETNLLGSTEKILNETVEILNREVTRLNKKSKNISGDKLTVQDVGILEKLSKTAVSISRELRELEKLADVGALSDEELLEKFQAANADAERKRKLELGES